MAQNNVQRWTLASVILNIHTLLSESQFTNSHGTNVKLLMENVTTCITELNSSSSSESRIFIIKGGLYYRDSHKIRGVAVWLRSSRSDITTSTPIYL